VPFHHGGYGAVAAIVVAGFAEPMRLAVDVDAGCAGVGVAPTEGVGAAAGVGGAGEVGAVGSNDGVG
jgi:hypothetical protein